MRRLIALALLAACDPPTMPPVCPARIPTIRGDTLTVPCDTLRGRDFTPPTPKRPR